IHRVPHHRLGGVYIPLGQTKQGEAGERLAPPSAGLAIGLLGLIEPALQAVKLTLTVVGPACRSSAGRTREPFTGSSRVVERVGPRTVDLHDLRASDQALALIRHEL